MNGLEIAVLAAGTGLLAVAMGVIVWRELQPGSRGSYVQTWRDLAGIVAMLSGLAVLGLWLWTGV